MGHDPSWLQRKKPLVSVYIALPVSPLIMGGCVASLEGASLPTAPQRPASDHITYHLLPGLLATAMIGPYGHCHHRASIDTNSLIVDGRQTPRASLRSIAHLWQRTILHRNRNRRDTDTHTNKGRATQARVRRERRRLCRAPGAQTAAAQGSPEPPPSSPLGSRACRGETLQA